MTIEIQGLAPLLQVFDMPTAIGYYRDKLGFAVTSTAPKLSDNPDDVNWCMLQYSGVTIMLNTAYEPEYRPPEPEAARFAGHGDTILYFGCPDVDGAHRELTEKGLRIKPPSVTHYGMKQISFNDPDGYGLVYHWRA